MALLTFEDLAALDAGDAQVAQFKEDYRRQGYCWLPSFVSSDVVQQLQCEAARLFEASADNSFRSTEDHTITLDSPSAHTDTATTQQSSKCLIAQDRLPTESQLLRLFRSPGLIRLLSLIIDRPVYCSDDPLGGVYYNVFEEGDALGWHFDRSPFFVNLLVSLPSEGGGGQFEFFADGRPQQEDADSDDVLPPVYEAGVARVARGEDVSKVVRPPLAEGGIIIFQGRRYMHRVTPVVGAGERRINAILTYADAPGFVLNTYTRQTFFGR
ncbi:unnamed protein product [Vitrella brassicaformis CCMP3155]|uniref:Fe2OG dioxygenase domain-containing protein n=2 Tax=Vitrella brassicaformis TaxID=1169539 RepID=A0A0G4G0J5_VITBC|nr:unnamed protein product [Vitrella brassicaformis CCMP3155]|mmetsp:Transcript_22158/g.54497  ORF Transcript_22158/g.54497 Transcript_22158/m.54497 type:complete len:269 (+) Transcript_22158:57-863(+)|eukprot:CEM21493.1 unnamed protein product [Vitrella brassicaformis CCMP3155]